MNMRTPLALAATLLMTSSSVMAQLNMTLSAFPAKATNSSLLFQPPAMTDFDYDCSDTLNPHIPWKECEAGQLTKRHLMRQLGTFGGGCPQPATDACQKFFMRESTGYSFRFSNPVDVISATTPPPGKSFTQPDCRQSGCPTKPIPQPGEEGFIGPPAPDATNNEIVVTGVRPLPPPIAEKNFSKAFADAQANTTKKVVKLDNGRFAVMNEEDGTAIVCGMQCDLKPRKPENVPGLAAALQLDASINSGNVSINADRPRGNDKGTGSVPAGHTPAATQTTGGDTGAYDAGKKVAALQNVIAGNKFESSSAGSTSGGTGGSDDSAAGATGAQSKLIPDKDIPAALAKLNTEGYTFIKNRYAAQIAEERIREAESFNRNNGRPADPPVSEYQGQIQAVPNSKP